MSVVTTGCHFCVMHFANHLICHAYPAKKIRAHLHIMMNCKLKPKIELNFRMQHEKMQDMPWPEAMQAMHTWIFPPV